MSPVLSKTGATLVTGAVALIRKVGLDGTITLMLPSVTWRVEWSLS